MTTFEFELSEAEVREALCGDERLFGQLVHRYKRSLMTVLQRRGTSRNDIEDCTQHAFFKLWEHREQIQKSSPVVFSWLCTTALNKARDTYKRTSRLDLVGDHELFDMFWYWEDALPDEHEIPRLHATIATLKEPYRSILTMQISGLSYKTMAQKLDCPIGTIMSGRSRAMNILKEAYKKYL